MGFEVIHNHHIARTELRNKELVDVAAEYLAVGTTIHSHGRREAAHASRADQRPRPASVARLGRIRPWTARRPGIRACHIDLTARFIDKDQSFALLLRHQLGEGRASLASRLGVLFGSLERLFSRVSPSWSSARGRVERPTRTWTFVANCSQRSARGVCEIVGCSIHSVSMNTCPSCQHSATKRDGYDAFDRQRYHCRPCRRDFTAHSASAFSGYRWPPDVILMAVRWYCSLPLSAAQVVRLLAERHIDVTARTVLNWVQTFGPQLATALRKLRRRVG